MSNSRLLICTVGGTHDPIIKSLIKWEPVKVWFVPTTQTKRSIEHDTVHNGKTVPSIVNAAKAAGYSLDAGRYDIHELSDGENLGLCLLELQRLTGDIERWVRRGEGFEVVVDFTGGTKCMSAAVALQASRWPCMFSYVGGARRTKDGVGIVEPGHERVVHQENPWEALGYRAVEDFMVLLGQHAFLAAETLAQKTKERVTSADRKSEFAVLEQLARGLYAWDRFDHKAGKAAFDNVVKSANNLRAVLGQERGNRIVQAVERLTAHLQELCTTKPPSRHHVIDLLANAMRRKDEGRFDDAVARLYRAIEAIAQVALKERHGIESTAKVPLKQIPESLRSLWEARAEDGEAKLGLQEAYQLLSALCDPLGKAFQDAGLNKITSPLNIRNNSILAHGFERVSDAVFDKLWSSALSLADVDDASLPSIPH